MQKRKRSCQHDLWSQFLCFDCDHSLQLLCLSRTLIQLVLQQGAYKTRVLSFWDNFASQGCLWHTLQFSAIKYKWNIHDCVDAMYSKQQFMLKYEPAPSLKYEVSSLLGVCNKVILKCAFAPRWHDLWPQQSRQLHFSSALFSQNSCRCLISI